MALSIFTANVTAFAATSTEYDYNLLSDGTAELTKYNKSQAVVNIPTEISKNILGFGDKIKVSKVADTCFNNCTSITEIGIPNGIAINAKSVNGCTALKQMYGLDSGTSYSNGGIVTKDTASFEVLFKVCAGNSYSKIDLTLDRFNVIGSYAFTDNTKLETIVLPADCKTVEANAFYNCPNLKTILYEGNSMAEFNAIKVGSGNDVFKNAKVTVHYYKAHSYQITSITKATLTKNGKVYRECSYCRKKVSKTVYYPKTIKLKKTKYTYNGKAQKPAVIVKNANGKTIAAKHYTVKYSKGRKKVGKYIVKIQFKGNYYKGAKKLAFTIVPKSTKITKIAKTKNSFTVKYNKVKGVSGYQVQYATDKKFTKNKKTFTLKGTSKKVAKLKAGKTYYVRVRTFKTVNKKKYYSNWTAVKAVKTKANKKKLTTEQTVKKLIKGHYLYRDEDQAPELYEFYFSTDNRLTRREYGPSGSNYYSCEEKDRASFPWNCDSKWTFSGTYTIKGNCISYQYYDTVWNQTVKGKIYYDTKRKKFKTEPMYIDAPFDDPSTMVVKELYYSKNKLANDKMYPVYSKLQNNHPYPNPYK